VMQDRGLALPDRAAAYAKVLERFREKWRQRLQVELKNQLQPGLSHDEVIELLKKLKPPDPGTPGPVDPQGNPRPTDR
jgi:hypothetical protein